jgi:predicted amidohydrolase
MTVIACIQMASGPNVGANLLEAERLIEQAVSRGAKLVILPENFALMGLSELDKVAACEAEDSGPMQAFLSMQAAKHGIWIVGGTIPLASHTVGKVRAACLVFDDKGRQAARYDKIHLFNARLIDSNEQYT